MESRVGLGDHCESELQECLRSSDHRNDQAIKGTIENERTRFEGENFTIELHTKKVEFNTHIVKRQTQNLNNPRIN